MGYSRNSGPLWVIDFTTAPNNLIFIVTKWDRNFGNYLFAKALKLCSLRSSRLLLILKSLRERLGFRVTLAYHDFQSLAYVG